MKPCTTSGCQSLSGVIHISGSQWISYCPVCKTTQPAEVSRQPDKADGLASRALAQLRRFDYAGAEQNFLDAAGLTADSTGRCAFYLWCSLIARYGVEYVQEVQFETIPAKRSTLFVPTFGRFPLPDHRITDTAACRQLDPLMLASPDLHLNTLTDELDILLREIEQCMRNEQNEFDVFIA